MIAPNGDVKIMDFGISRSFAEDVTMTGSVVGTPAYMAPEQAEGRVLDQRTDIYAFGLILYEMFTGEAAFKGDTAVTVALKQIRERPTLPTLVVPSIPKHVEAAIMKCLEKDPAACFQTIEDAVRALEGAAPATTTQPTPLAVPPAKRNLAMPAIAVLAVAVIAAAGWWWFNRPSDSVRFPLEKFTLANGLEVVLSPDHASPTFSLTVAYRSGVRFEPRDRLGMAQLAQHAVYEGFPNVARGEYQDLIAEAGGSTDGNTTGDITFFWTTLPANQLDLAPFLESDRMRSLELTQEGLDAARGILLEKRARAMSNPYAVLLNHFYAVPFDNVANQQPGLVVTPEQLRRYTVEDVRNFFQSFYSPANAGLALVGDFDPAKARAHRALLREHRQAPCSAVSRYARARPQCRAPGDHQGARHSSAAGSDRVAGASRH
jgi:hypothetical protein